MIPRRRSYVRLVARVSLCTGSLFPERLNFVVAAGELPDASQRERLVPVSIFNVTVFFEKVWLQ